MTLDVRTNPALMKLDLYCRGLRLDDSVLVADEGGRPILRTRAGLGSGLELVLPGGHWTNAPVTEEFARKSPWVLRKVGTELVLHREREPVAPVQVAPRPDWYLRRTSSGKPMSRIGTLQGTYLGIYASGVCEFWKGATRQNCHFCSVGLNIGADDDADKTSREVVEVARAAVAESGATYVDFNAGHDEREAFLDRIAPLAARVKEATGALVGVQAPPYHELERYRWLRAQGVNRVSFCFELFDPERFREVCPGKHRRYGLERYLRAIEWTARLGRERMRLRGPGGRDLAREPWVVNGEIIAGLEPPEATMQAIDWITGVGAIPTVCVFRPLRGTDYEHLPPPRTEELVPVFQHLYRACMDRGLPIGVAPNVKVSLVLLPEECRALVPARLRDRLREARLAALRRAFAWRFYRERDRALARTAAASAA